MSSNLPPGVSNAMIEDQASDQEFETFVEELSKNWDTMDLDLERARLIWQMGLTALDIHHKSYNKGFLEGLADSKEIIVELENKIAEMRYEMGDFK